MGCFTRTIFSVLLLVFLLSAPAAAGKKDGSINDYSGSFWSAHSINNLGYVAGTASGFSKDGYSDGALFDGDNWHQLAGPNDVKIPAPPSVTTSMTFAFYAKDINNAGQVVGGGDGGAGVMVTPVIIQTKKGETRSWYRDENNDGKNDLITKILIDGYNDSNKGHATHVTDNGAVYGVLYDIVGTMELAAQTRLYRWTPQDGGQIIDAPYPYDAMIMDVNEAGEVIGICNEYERKNAAHGKVGFYWSKETGIIRIPVDLGGDSSAIDINEAGEVIGRVSEISGSAFAFRWKPATGDFAVLPELQSAASAYAINDSGVISGWSNGFAVTWNAQNNIGYLGNGTYQSCTANDYNNNGYAFGYCDNGMGTARVMVAWIPDATTDLHVLKEIEPKKGAGVWHKSSLNESNQFVACIHNAKKNSTNEVIMTLQ